MLVQVSISILVIVVTASVVVTYIGIIFGLLCGIEFMQKKIKENQFQQKHSHT